MSVLESIREWLNLGGPVVGILLAMSIVAMSIAVLKIYQFVQVGTVVPEGVSRAVDTFGERRFADAERILDAEQGLAADIATWVMCAMKRHAFDPATTRETVTRLAADHLMALRSHFRTLEAIAALAPLLGLFGTVLGMIEAFRELENAGSEVDPSLLSGGIWEALLTTAVGLAVAMPTVALLNLLEQRVDAFAHQLDSLISRLFTSDVIAVRSAEAGRTEPSVTQSSAAKPNADNDLRPAQLPGA